MKLEKGTLYLVATPIGNLEDITLRAINVLQAASTIYAEDTRALKRLLEHYDIQNKKVFSYREKVHEKVAPQILDQLKRNKSVVLVSTRGTPLIADPGYPLVKEVLEQDLNVITIPGASAVLTALVSSGAPPYPFSFLGFLPLKGNKRKKIIKNYGELNSTLVIYESPFRVKDALADIKDLLGDRTIAICSELTKLNEVVARGKISEALEELPKKLTGEFTIVVYPD